MTNDIYHALIESLTCDPIMQSRVRLDEEHVERLRTAYERGDDLPPVDVVHDTDSGIMWVVDGHHRVAAARLAGFTRLPCRVFSGTRQDALKRSAQANPNHGLPRSSLDVWFILERWLTHPVMREDPFPSIARAIQVDTGLVRRVAGMLALLQRRSDDQGPPSGMDTVSQRPLLRHAPGLPPAMPGWRWKDACGWEAPGYILVHQSSNQSTAPAWNYYDAIAMAQYLDIHDASGADQVWELNAPVIVIGPQASPYQAPPLVPARLRRLETERALVETDAGRFTLPVHRVRQSCESLPEALKKASDHYQSTLRQLADMLRRMRRYDQALEAHGGIWQAGNPLDDLAIMALDPDRSIRFQPADWYALPLIVEAMHVMAHTLFMVQARPLRSASGNRNRLLPQADLYLAAPLLRDLALDYARLASEAYDAWRHAIDRWLPIWDGPPPQRLAPRTVRDTPVVTSSPSVLVPDHPDHIVITQPVAVQVPPPANGSAKNQRPSANQGDGTRDSWDMESIRQAMGSLSDVSHDVVVLSPDETDRLSKVLLENPLIGLRVLAMTMALWRPAAEAAIQEITMATHGDIADVAHMSALAILESIADAPPDVHATAREALHHILGYDAFDQRTASYEQHHTDTE